MTDRETYHAWSREEVWQLMKQAEDFLQDKGQGLTPLTFITRDKHQQYFTEIFQERNGIMRKYIKDRDGNPKKPYGNPTNPINGVLEGLFFSAIVDGRTGEPYVRSVYGSRRLKLPVDRLITTEKNLYFSDFYCMATSKSKKHAMILVLCEAGSPEDQFCRAHLAQLDMTHNPFLMTHNDGTAEVATGADVEIFYTEDLDISQYREFMTDVEHVGTPRITNPEKNTLCKYCNLN